MRLLFAASGGEGHLGPLLPYVDAARTAGDDVVLVVPPDLGRTARCTGAECLVTAAPPIDEVRAAYAALTSSNQHVRAHAAEVELFGRLNTAAALEVLGATAASFKPDLIVREPCDYSSAIVAARSSVSMATIGISPGRADRSGLAVASPVIEPYAPGVTTLIAASPYLTRFPMEGETGFRDTRLYGFPAVVQERNVQEPPVVWLTMGTVNTRIAPIQGTWDAAVRALAGLDVLVVASTGRSDVALNATEKLEVVDWVDLDDILGRASVVVCHGGSGTTLAALSAGVPVVCVPMIADQPANAAMVERLGAGITIASEQSGASLAGLTGADVPRLRNAVNAVLSDPAYGRAALNASAQFAVAPNVAYRLDQLRHQFG